MGRSSHRPAFAWLAVAGTALVATALAAHSGGEGQERTPIEGPAPSPATPKQQPSIGVSNAELIALGIRALEGSDAALQGVKVPFDRGREGLFVSVLRSEVLRFVADDHGVNIVGSGLGLDAPKIGRWDIGRDSLPSHVTLREFADGSVIAAARVSSGAHQMLCIGHLEWERDGQGGSALLTRRTALFEAATPVGSNGQERPAMEEVPTAALRDVVPLDWDPSRQRVRVAAANGANHTVLELEATFEEADLPVPMTELQPWAAVAAKRPMTARTIAKGEAAHAAGDYLLVRTRPEGRAVDVRDDSLPVALLARNKQGGWDYVSRPGAPGALLAGRTMAGWVDDAGALHMATLRATGSGSKSELWTARFDAGKGLWVDMVASKQPVLPVAPRQFVMDARRGAPARLVVGQVDGAQRVLSVPK